MYIYYNIFHYIPTKLHGVFKSSIEFSMFHDRGGKQIVMFSHDAETEQKKCSSAMHRSSHTRQGDAFTSGGAVGTSGGRRIPQHFGGQPQGGLGQDRGVFSLPSHTDGARWAPRLLPCCNRRIRPWDDHGRWWFGAGVNPSQYMGEIHHEKIPYQLLFKMYGNIWIVFSYRGHSDCQLSVA